jgi:hypothetical protein
VKSRASGYTILELLISISALALGVCAAYAAQLSATDLGRSARERDLATFASNGAIESVLARPFADMIDPEPVAGSIDETELAAFQPPYDPRGYATFAASPSTYPDAPKTDYVSADPTLFGKVLLYGPRVWEPVSTPQTKIDPATGLSYKLYPLGELQRTKVVVWFEPRPTVLNGATGAYQSTVSKTSSLGFPKLIPQLSDPTDEASSLPCTVVTAIAWFPARVEHDFATVGEFNPLTLFVPPSDGSGTFTGAESTQLKTLRDALKAKGLRIQMHRTVVKQ